MKRKLHTSEIDISSKKRKSSCFHNGCTKYPTFNHPGEKTVLYCKEHSEPGMIDVKHKRCNQSGCIKQPSFNHIGEETALYCKEHSELGMIDVNTRKCAYAGCKTVPFYNYQDEPTGLYCKQHSLPNMLDVKTKKCIYSECRTVPNYNYKGEVKPLYCKRHSLVGMINIKSRRCAEPECVKQPNYNFEGEDKGLYCKQHSQPDMMDVKSRKCAYPGCRRVPCFNFEGEDKGLFCKEHSEPDMIDVKTRKCTYPGCKRVPCFNFERENKGLFCKQHSQPQMINVTTRSKLCNHLDCKIVANFNYEEKSNGLYCKTHAKLGMTNVTYKPCIANECTKQRRYGIPGQSPERCTEHKQDGDIPYPKRRCEAEDCKEFAIFGISGAPQYCEQHKSVNHLNLVQHECTVCSVLEIVDNEGKCSRCSDYLTKKLHLRKQRLVKSWIDSSPHVSLKTYRYDAEHEHGVCGKERPDFLWDSGTHKVVLEVDEDQHFSRPCECEQTRMVNLTGSFGMPTIWIRYNPDSFAGSGGTTTKERVRREQLLKILNWALSSIDSSPKSPEQYCRVLYLFFDGFCLGKQNELINIPML